MWNYSDAFEPRFLIIDLLCASFVVDRLGVKGWQVSGILKAAAADLAVGFSLYNLASHDVNAFADPSASPLLRTALLPGGTAKYQPLPSSQPGSPRTGGPVGKWALPARIARIVGWTIIGLITAFCAGYAISSRAGLTANGTKPSVLDILRNITSIFYAAGSVDAVFKRAAIVYALISIGIADVLIACRLFAVKYITPQQRRSRRLTQANIFCVLTWLLSILVLFTTTVDSNLFVRSVSTILQRPWRQAMASAPVHLISPSRESGSVSTADFFLPEIHGRSNIDNPPRWTKSVERRLYKHVFVIWLESADANIWPWKKTYCAGHKCEDIKDEHNSASYMTPFFANLTKHSLYVPSFVTNSAYSVKSDHSSACGMHPPISDFNSVENDIADQRPCLAHILQSRSYATGFFSAAETSLDHFHTILEKQGWQEIYGLERLREDYPDTELVEPRLAEDHGIIRPMSDWLDTQLRENKPTVMSWHTSTIHWPFLKVPRLDLERYTWLAPGEVQNRHLNLVRYTDGVLKEFYDMLESKGILDDSLIVIHGDHGPRVNKLGTFIAETHNHENLAVPAIISTPSTRARSEAAPPLAAPASELWSTTDVLPTLLDLMEFPADLIREYPGQSILRPINQRLVFSGQVPGATHLQADNGRFKAVRDTWNSPDYCGFDRALDPLEELGWCTTTGWMKQEDKDGASITGESLFASADDAAHFIEWVKWAGLRTAEHTAYTGWYWSNSTRNAEFNADFRTRWQMTETTDT